MSASVIAAGIGAIGSLLGQKKASKQAKAANRFNAWEAHKARLFSLSEARKTRQFDSREAQKARVWNRDQVLDARRFDTAQIADTRVYERQQALDTEARARAYLEEDREYSSPAAVRARLEEAGMNPLTGSDASVALATPGAINPSAVSAAQSGIASAIAPTASMAQTVVSAPAVLPPAPDYSFVGDVVAAYGEQKRYEAEYALRKSQVQLENQRLTQIMHNASARPITGGIGPAASGGAILGGRVDDFVNGVPQGTWAAREPASPPQGGAPTSAGFIHAADGMTARRKAYALPDAQGRVSPEMDVVNAEVLVFNPVSGTYHSMPNPDLLEGGLTEMVDAGIGALAVDQAQKWAKQPVGNNGATNYDVLRRTPGMVKDMLGIMVPAFAGADSIKAQRTLPRKPGSPGVSTRRMSGY